MRRRSIFPTILTIFVIGALVIAGYLLFKDLDGPTVQMTPSNGKISPKTKLKFKISDPAGIRSLVVGIRRNNVFNQIYNHHFDIIKTEQEVEVPLHDAQLREGAFEMEIRATDDSLAGFGLGNTRTILMPMQLDMQPPRISIKTTPPSVRRGGSAVIRYTVDEEISESGVMIGDYFVPGFLQKDGSYLCFFPFPYTMSAAEYKKAIEITATDLAGNITRSRLNVMSIEKTFKHDKIELKDNFLQTVASKLRHLAPDVSDPLQCYLYINKEVRAANVQMLRDLRFDTAAAMLWQGVFTRLPHSAFRAGFADHRLFSYQGKQVGESYHLGFDMASVRNAPVPAANSGRVIFTGELGIYGNLIIIDHGLGLMSLYSHLSEISTKTGEIVEKGAIIGLTGYTGLAFGDHLHFGILVGGIEVTPLEWIDAKWIRDNITNRINIDQPSK